MSEMISVKLAGLHDICSCGRYAYCVFVAPRERGMMFDPVDMPACVAHMPDVFEEMAILYGDGSCSEPRGLLDESLREGDQ